MKLNKLDNKVIIVAAFLVVTMFALLVVFNHDQAITIKYNNFEFEKIDRIWQTQWQQGPQLYILDFQFNPLEVEDVPIEGVLDERFQSRRVYITIDPSDERRPETSYVALAAIEISRKLIDPFDREVIAACTRNETIGCIDRPVITCDNSNTSVIYLKESKDAKILLNGNCATIQGTNEGIVKAAHKAVFSWLHIIN